MLCRFLLMALIAACTLPSKAQSNTLSLSAKIKKATNLAKWEIPPGNYSGITYLGNNQYAVVTDKAKSNGFYIFEILLSPKGKITSVTNLGFRSDSIHTDPRDMEGIVYVPKDNTVFISAESDQQIYEYTLEGQQTGRFLNIPEQFSTNNIQSNYGFEALAYSPETQLFWTTTENALLEDKKDSDSALTLRLQSFTEDLQPDAQYIYQTDTPKKSSKKHRYYAFGVPSITALPDSSLLILERELYIPPKYINSFVKTKIYHTKPSSTTDKSLVCSFKTPLQKLSNYEGMCLGPKLLDGSQVLLLICDSQDNAGNKFYHLKDRIRVIILKGNNK